MSALTISLLLLSSGETPTTTKQWYGLENLAWDGAAYTSIAVGAAGKPPRTVFSAIGLGLYALGGPTAHLMHGNPGRAVASLGLRATPIVLGLGLYELCPKNAVAPATDGCSSWTTFGFIVGATVATIVDASALAYEERKPGLRLQPLASLTRDGGTLGLGGMF